MWSRFQIGSNMPLAKRSAIRFWTASRPRKWSIRKTRSSGKTPWTSVLSSTRALEVDAERLLEHHARALGEARAAERLDGGAERVGRDREVVQPAGLAAELRLGALDRLDERLGVVGAERAERQVLRRSAPTSRRAASPTALRAIARKSSSDPPLREVPMTL